MLLERKTNQTIVIQAPDGTEIDITVSKAETGQVTLNIDAPEEFLVQKEELVEDSSMELELRSKGF